MKKTIVAFIAFLFILKVAAAQKAVLHITLLNSTNPDCSLSTSDAFDFDYLKKGDIDIHLGKGYKSLYTFNLTQPRVVSFFCSRDSTRSNSLSYVFFLSPGDDLFFKADFSKNNDGIVVTGKGANNNQPLIGSFDNIDLMKFYGDTIPNRVIDVINHQQSIYKSNAESYIKQFKPTAAFIKNINYNVEYNAANTYYNFKENNKFQVRDAYTRNFDKWQHVNDSLFAIIKLNNNDALISNSYTGLIRSFLMREKERLWGESFKNPAAFFKEWYNTDATAGSKLFNDDQQNLLKEKIINKYFTGKSAEYLYAVLLDNATAERNPKNIVQIFERFMQRYPHSKYVEWFSPSIDTVKRRQQQRLTADMVFVTDNGIKLNNFDEVLALTKGKTILLDMWGTWCGPCRSEIEKNGAAIKAHFKDKGVSYLYVANFDLQNEKEWKSLIAYFDLKGTHILANKNLSQDIMAKVKGNGYPTYVVIKKDGSYEQSKAGYPMNRDLLIKQLEEALAQ